MSKPFDLEIAITTWRRFHEQQRAFSVGDLDELERHLRDHTKHLVEAGQEPEAAFHRAVEAVGDYGAGELEYRKVQWAKLRRQGRIRHELTWRLSMLKNYWTVAVRSMQRQKGYASINIVGLTLGLACFMLLALLVQFELSYDTFYPDADQTYRIVRDTPNNAFRGTTQKAVTAGPLVPALQAEFPEVAAAAQLARAEAIIRHNGEAFNESGIFASPGLFEVFSFPAEQGTLEGALAAPDRVVLTASLAEKYFGTANPVGQTLLMAHTGEHFSGELTMTVAAVIADVPPNSHLAFDYVLPAQSSRELAAYLDAWFSNSYATYVRLRTEANLDAFGSNLAALGARTAEAAGDDAVTYLAQPLTDIYLRSEAAFEFGARGDLRYVYLFAAIAVLIVLIAGINYVNLATARSAVRAREVGVRKVLGAHRRQLMGQFMAEAVVPALLAVVLALAVVVLVLPAFSGLVGRPLTLDGQGSMLALLVGIGLSVGVLAGSYPALLLSGFEPVRAMKGRAPRQAGRPTLRRVLVVSQFAVTIALLVGTFAIRQQLRFMQQQETGLDREQVIQIEMQDRTVFDDRYLALKQTLEAHPRILGVTAAQTSPVDVDAASPAQGWEGAPTDARLLVYRSIIQHDFVDVFGLELVEGRDLSPDRSADAEEGMLINETLRQQLGWTTAVGRRFDFHGREALITGVVKDFHFHSLHREVAPIAMFPDSGWWFPYQRVFVKVRPEAMPETVAFLEATMAEFSPGYPLEYTFLDEAYAQMYQTEAQLGGLVNAFTALALLIACLGLFGLAAYAAERRTKEIGVRKVLGASVPGLAALLAREFVGLMLVAFVVAAPIAYVVMQQWLDGFAYRIDLGIGLFVGTAVLVLAVALLTV
ncbi:MAG: ABC transporter permease, partial [Bacteroidota bacterium]